MKNKFLLVFFVILIAFSCEKSPTDSEPIQDVIHWLQTEGDNIIYIYGRLDPWTGGAIELTGQTNPHKIIQPNEDHSVKIADLDEQQLVYSTLELWLGIEINPVGQQIAPISFRTKNTGELVIHH